MIRTVSIVPTILTDNKQEYRAQAEKINFFTRRVQIDVTDGKFAPTQTLDITNIWWPKNWEADLHLMVTNPSEHLDTVLKLNPSLCILHAEASEDLLPSFQTLKDAGIKVGVALLPSGANITNVRAIAHADVDIINVGSAIATADNPAAVFEELVAEIDKNGVVL